jgi:hypothetical protein
MVYQSGTKRIFSEITGCVSMKEAYTYTYIYIYIYLLYPKCFVREFLDTLRKCSVSITSCYVSHISLGN